MSLEIWNQLKTPPQTALKEIRAGRLKGMNDINPQWRIMAMTKQFGVCGIGWKYTIDKQWVEVASNGEVLAFVNVSLYIRADDKWSEAIPANGGSKLTAKESSGLYNSDEAYKMAFTDALGVAMKMLGMAADVYMGVFDGKNSGQEQKQPQQKPVDQGIQQKPNEIISDSEWSKLVEKVNFLKSKNVNVPTYDREKMKPSDFSGVMKFLDQKTSQVNK